jgi:hypothetical protein
MGNLIIVKGIHKRKIPVLGVKYGNYEIISTEIATDSFNKRTYWLVKCTCGNEKFIRHDILTSNSATKCRNCSNKEKYINNVNLGKMHSKKFSPKHRGVGELPKIIYSHYKRNAKTRNLEFNVSIEYLWDLYQKQNGKCALTGLDIYLTSQKKFDTVTKVENKNRNIDYSKFNASLDRIDSSIGYVEGNLQWVGRKVNIIKNDIHQDDFIKLCTLISNYANQKPN